MHMKCNQLKIVENDDTYMIVTDEMLEYLKEILSKFEESIMRTYLNHPLPIRDRKLLYKTVPRMTHDPILSSGIDPEELTQEQKERLYIETKYTIRLLKISCY